MTPVTQGRLSFSALGVVRMDGVFRLVTACAVSRLLWRACAALGAVLLGTTALASELVYSPTNPSFGGNPLHGSVLLNAAQAENTFKDPELQEDELTPLEDFNERLQRSVLNRLTSTIASTFVDDEGNLIPGQTQTSDFIIEIVDAGDGTVTVTTTDRLTGDATAFTVQSSF